MAIVYGCLPSPGPNITSPAQAHPATSSSIIKEAAKNIPIGARPYKRLISSGGATSSMMSSRILDFRLPATRIVVDCPESELRARGISFTGIGDSSCVVRMALENGTTAKFLLPSGLITSFKARMWHGGTMELLHTLVTEGEDEVGAAALIQGGLSLALGCQNDTGVSWSPDAWDFHRVSGTPQESIQVELIGRSKQTAGNVDHEVKHIISLGRDVLTSEVVVQNSSSSSPLSLTGSAICHLAVSTPDATYAVGLEGSDFFTLPPLVSNFTVIPPDPTGKKVYRDPWKLLWPFNEIMSTKWNTSRNSNTLEDPAENALEGEEEDNYKHLTEKQSRIYTSAPRVLSIIDRGRRNSVTMRRNGFKELYIFSPGSEHEWYKKYSYVCIGHSALLEPIMLNAKSEWRGGLRVWNPNS